MSGIFFGRRFTLPLWIAPPFPSRPQTVSGRDSAPLHSATGCWDIPAAQAAGEGTAVLGELFFFVSTSSQKVVVTLRTEKFEFEFDCTRPNVVNAS